MQPTQWTCSPEQDRTHFGKRLRKLLESDKLRQQALNNTKEQFANSPDLPMEIVNAIMSALDAHTSLSTQALNSQAVQTGMKDILLRHSKLWETLRKAEPAP